MSSDLRTGLDLTLKPYLGEWGQRTPQIHFGGQVLIVQHIKSPDLCGIKA